MPNTVLTAFLRLPISLRILSIAASIILFFGMVITIVEPDNFPSFFEGVWWAIITASTVGYGDYTPTTIIGRLTGMLLILTGAGFLSTYLVTLATAAVARQNAFLEGKSAYKGRNHIVIIGWNERSKALIHSITKDGIKAVITLVDESLSQNPSPESLHFIQGNPNIDETLLRANILKASKVIITADQSKEEMYADMNSILTLLAIKGLNPEVPCIIEILTVEQVTNANRAGADEIIQTNRLSSFVMHSSLNSQDTMIAFLDLLGNFKDKRLQIVPLGEWRNEERLDFAALSSYLLLDDKLLLGVKRGSQSYIKPGASFMVEEKDELILIAGL
ncbi:potassium channel protein [Niallia circulans]|uniref:Potassium channel protein n=1 Tax=Niallia circulans TaxID=1397 RepID=A0A553SJL5_NIACI|nr:potassium channel family protein [Niallia circulans]TRZ37174.1 potassium channel protein [Niallia circulans]